MISDKLVSLETAKLAKEMGFNWLCGSVKIETIEGSEREVYDEEECRYIPVKDVVKTRIPTQARLQRWLREEKNIVFGISPMQEMGCEALGWCATIYKVGENGYELSWKEELYYNTYELVLENALKYALENLV